MKPKKRQKELYTDAYICFDKGELDEALNLTRILLMDFPNSKEARWSLRNFPVVWDVESGTVSIDERKLQATDRLLLMILSFTVFFLVHIIAESFHFDWIIERYVPLWLDAWLILFFISLFTSGLVAGFLYRAKRGDDYRHLVLISPGYYLAVFFGVIVFLNLIASPFYKKIILIETDELLAILYLPALWMLFSYSGVIAGQGLRKLNDRERQTT